MILTVNMYLCVGTTCTGLLISQPDLGESANIAAHKQYSDQE